MHLAGAAAEPIDIHSPQIASSHHHVRRPLPEFAKILLRRRTQTGPSLLDDSVPSAARKLAQRAASVSWREAALTLRTYAIASEVRVGKPLGESPEGLYTDSQQWNLTDTDYSLLSAQLAFRSSNLTEQKQFVSAFLAGPKE